MYFLNAYNNKFMTYNDFLLFYLFDSATLHLFQFCLKRAEARWLKGDRDALIEAFFHLVEKFNILALHFSDKI